MDIYYTIKIPLKQRLSSAVSMAGGNQRGKLYKTKNQRQLLYVRYKEKKVTYNTSQFVTNNTVKHINVEGYCMLSWQIGDQRGRKKDM